MTGLLSNAASPVIMAKLNVNYNADVTTYRNSSTTLEPFLRVFDTGGAIRPATDTEIENGIILRRTLPFRTGAVMPLQSGQRVTMVASGGISVDADVFAAPDGKVSSSGQRKIGRAQTASSVDGDHIDVVIVVTGDGGGGGGGEHPIEVVRQAGDLTGTAPSEAKLGVDQVDGDLFYKDNVGNWAPVSIASGIEEVIRQSGDLSGSAPANADWGINKDTGAIFYADDSDTWQPITVGEQNVEEVLRQVGAFSGAAPNDADLGVNTLTGDLYYKDGSSQWQPINIVDMPEEVLRQAGDFSGVAPAGADLAVNQLDGTLFYKDDAGAWQEIIIGAGGGDNEVVRSATDVSGAAPADADLAYNHANGNLFYKDTAGDWQPYSPNLTGSIYEEVATKANRTSTPTLVGFRSFVETNNVTYIWDGAQYQVELATKTGTTAERNALSEHEPDQVFIDIELGEILVWDTAISGTDKWRQP